MMQEQTLVLASNNVGKIKDMKEILQPFGIIVRSQREAGLSIEVEETGKTFAENALLKASAIYQQLHCPVIADDSGLIVDALNGEPGVHSHRFAGEHATDEQRCQKILEQMQDVPAEKRTARFACVICYLNEEGRENFFTGYCEGKIGTVPKGKNGFGYDPIFVVGSKTMAEMTEEEKNAVSHRGNALAALKAYLENRKEYNHVDK